MAVEIRDANREKPTVFVTMDINLRIRADALGLRSANYENQSVRPDTLNPGVVELTLALHRVFRTPEDQFVFDVAHQGYVHKLLTGRGGPGLPEPSDHHHIGCRIPSIG